MKKIFKYREANACDCADGDDDGFSITIYNDGIIVYEKYIVPDKKVFIEKYRVSNRVIIQLKEYIQRCNYKRISQNLNNESYDGSFNIFCFWDDNEKLYCIDSLNIDDSRIFLHGEIPKSSNDIDERNLLIIFDNISRILSKAGYRLSTYSFRKKFLKIF